MPQPVWWKQRARGHDDVRVGERVADGAAVRAERYAEVSEA
jgi:hypothetical protein